ncbi:pre-mRNA splicing factor component-domain-containing protein [Thamnocephalis sphaerospora]|uniref:Pre-mRNA splicing factor component-domain-containing protein n=1 Tax=Thamnocephalis sphaerospora TaxID=78915 RepID=A0A4P9XTF6_9FUNG|nr:pre-mRNA splicing factor component-domain-containing protein [Thamnocephalis sphaerospora]|eukprot:RKP09426.1 pre-mRNA splicing factor component-domain-containing protein [Thamnocephalis sphaerospora]
MRIIIKGGVWKNTEDEILKAAVMKYGKNQWARISSLLVRKTPSQCKARWYEWLDPSIKKTEWSREEDEKLLHLAKLMPTQWRTIAPLVGRTPAQCLERYQRLLDEAEQQDQAETGDAGPSADDVRRLRPGEIDPDPETKPARPDPVDMDEDEKEMLSEARARLANTQGKKAKRKAREKQLEEARRLTALQKRRELKAAGIVTHMKKKKKHMDYNADIPFEKKATPGFYDTIAEDMREQREKKFKPIDFRKLDGRKAAEIEEEERRKDLKRQKMRTEKGEMPFVQANAKALEEQERERIAKRKKLVLPSPQIGEGELEELVKLGLAGESAKDMVDVSEGAASRALLGSYSSVNTGMPARTPRTPAAENTILMEARNLRAMNSAQTPLLGEENAELQVAQGGTGYEGATPRRLPAATPNPLLTPLRGATPRHAGGATPARTPFRDEMGINDGDTTTMAEATPREEKQRLAEVRRRLAQDLSRLPAPKNDFEVLLPEQDEGKDTASADETSAILDASERERRQREARLAEEQARLLRRSQAVQRDLPRPVLRDGALDALTQDVTAEDGELAEAERLIAQEMALLLRYDAVHHPQPGTKPSAEQDVALEPLGDQLIATARQLVADELAQQQRQHPCDVDEIAETWEKVQAEVRAEQAASRTPAEAVKEEQRLFEKTKRAMINEASRAAKIEKKLGVTLGGYRARSRGLGKQMTDAFVELDDVSRELSSFDALRLSETGIAARRLETLQADVDALMRRESELQQRYMALSQERDECVRKATLLQQHVQSRAAQTAAS